MKLIKLDLPINGIKVRNLEELRANFTTEILELYGSGMLLRWLKSRKLTIEADKLSMVTGHYNDDNVLYELCEILGMDADRLTWFKNSRLYVSLYENTPHETSHDDSDMNKEFFEEVIVEEIIEVVEIVVDGVKKRFSRRADKPTETPE